MDSRNDQPVYTYLAGLALFDSDFRRALLEDPVAAARHVGVALSDSQAEYLQSLDPESIQLWFDQFEENFGHPVFAMSGW